MLTDIAHALTRMLNDDTGRWLLSPDHVDSAAELAIDYLDATGTLQRAVVDRTFVDDGVRWIVDYKSSSPREGEALDDFLDRESTAYLRQIKRYADLFREQPSIRAMLYFPALGAFREIPL